MAAVHVVGKDLEFGLVVHRRLRRQQDRPRLHLAVGLLRARLDDHFALEDADRLVGDDVAVEFAALAAWGGVHHLQRGVGVAAPVEQAQASKPDPRPLAFEDGEGLPPHQRAAGDEAETVESRALGEPHDLTFDMEARRVLDQGDMGGGRAGREVEPGRDMALRAGAGADEAFDDDGARVGAKREGEARIDRLRAVGAATMNDLDRRRLGACGEGRRQAALGQRDVERQQRIVGSERRRRRSGDDDAGRRRIGQGGDETAVEQHKPGRADARQRGEPAASRLHRRVVGRSGERRGARQRRAKIGVMPSLHPPGRQTRPLRSGGTPRREAARRPRPKARETARRGPSRRRSERWRAARSWRSHAASVA